MVIGGMFELEKIGNIQNKEMDNTIYAMSGRCAIYACLFDMEKNVKKKVAYVPAYTCETVLESYIKAGYSLKFYDISPEGLIPSFKEEDLDGVGVMNVAGYYGFITYDKDFIKLAKAKGIIILQDITHSPTYIEPLADYAAGSLRKWMGIASGGIAIKKGGSFEIKMKNVEKEHMDGRYKAMEKRSLAIKNGDDSYNKAASDIFWSTELRLRKIFDAYSSDDMSIDIIKHFDFNHMIEKRRHNFAAIISNLKEHCCWRPIFNNLDNNSVPSHFSLYADNREELRTFLEKNEIASTVYWPLPPMIDDINRYSGANWIYNHIMSIQLDQRYNDSDMLYLANQLNCYSDFKKEGFPVL